MKTKFIFAVLLSLVVLSGCQTNPPIEKIVYVDVVRIPDIPSNYLQKCDISVPPSKEDYLELDLDQKESTLSSYITLLLSDLNKCGIKIKSIDDIITKFKNQYK